MPKLKGILSLLLIFLVGCQIQTDAETEQEEASGNQTEEKEAQDSVDITEAIPIEPIGKIPPNYNPVLAHQFGADPYVLVYEDRVYLYNTYDQFEYDADGNITENTYAGINQISVVSSADLVNWTDHGLIDVAGPNGAARWATQSWAPAAAHKVIDGEDRFFLYFANNASGIGVLTSDSPIGPFEDPIGEPLISWSTPGVEGVTWLFDPAVIVDDDQTSYLYFGGGIPDEEYAMPNTARVIQLGDDMMTVHGEAEMIPAPFMFESSGINKWNDIYYYTYSSNFYDGERPEGSPGGGEIAYMTSEQPMGPWEYKGTILKNPGHFFGVGGNNHQVLFDFHDQTYIAYHAQTLADAMDAALGYRSTHINQVLFNENGSIQEVEANLAGVEPVRTLHPYEKVQAETMAWNAGVSVQEMDTDEDGSGLAVTEIEAGDWIAVASVDFESGASEFSAVIASESTGGTIEVRLDDPAGELIGTMEVPVTGGGEQWQTITTEVSSVSGVHDVYFVFNGTGETALFNFDYWYFSQ